MTTEQPGHGTLGMQQGCKQDATMHSTAQGEDLRTGPGSTRLAILNTSGWPGVRLTGKPRVYVATSCKLRQRMLSGLLAVICLSS